MNRKEEIIKEAAILFKERGYGAASMRELAERVGIEAASLYNHIKSKDEILKEICFNTAKQYTDQLDLIEIKTSSSIAKLDDLIRLHVSMVVACREEVFVCNNEFKHLKMPHLADFQTVRRGYEKRFLGIIKAGIETGELKALDANTALFTILSAVRWLEMWYRPERKISAEELHKNVASMLLDGLKS
jgi:TetR/AcrR family transcriptional regulator, cholesterol catabolism regulator